MFFLLRGICFHCCRKNNTADFLSVFGCLIRPVRLLCFGLYTGGMIACRFFVFLSLFVLLFGVSVVVAEGRAAVSGGVREEMMGALEDCLLLTGGRDECYAALCEYEPGYLCAEDVLDVATAVAGPERAIGVLHDIMASPVFAITTDGHLLSHVVGRATSRVFGSSGENFLRCPHDFNDGCYHGFFEDTLAKVDDPVAVAIEICESMPSDTTSHKQRSYCYHGAGHVFLMYESHDLDAALTHCTAIPHTWEGSCLGGVFMENAWPSRDWEAKSVNFRKDDLLYPCNAVEKRFRPACYVEHYSYLMHEHTDSLEGLVAVCIGAGEYIRHCIGGIALMLQNPSRTDTVAKDFPLVGKSHLEKIIFLCNQFPEDYQGVCPRFLVGALLNFDYPDMSRTVAFCEGIASRLRLDCFRQAGSYLRHLGDEGAAQMACASIPDVYRAVCIGSDVDDAMVVVSEFAGWERSELNFTLRVDSPHLEGAVGWLGPVVGVVVRFFSDLFDSLSVLFARPVSAQGSGDSSLSGILFSEIERCWQRSDGRAACYASLCEYEPGYLCAEDILGVVTREVDVGPEVGMRVLAELVVSPLFDLAVGDSAHNLAHTVGRTTARDIGMDGESFLRCPTSFDYGCVHGFLEVALVAVESPSSKINEVCESLPVRPGIGRPNCYHGSGHGVMMHVSYNLPEALAICDGLLDSESCWSGVFMENIDGRHRVFEFYPENSSLRDDNPHSPCDSVMEKYRQTCYRLHMPYLAQIFQYDVRQVVNTCLGAGVHIEDCVFGFGWHALFEGLQDSLHPDPSMSVVEKTIYLCNQFPEQYRGICYGPAVNQITVSHGTERSFSFCETVDEQYRWDCYREVGRRLDDLVLHSEEKAGKCAPVPAVYRDACLGRDDRSALSAEEHVVEHMEMRADRRNSLFSRVWYFFRDIISPVVTLFVRPVSAQQGVDLQSGAQRCLSLTVNQGACFVALCEYEPGYLCADTIVGVITAAAGPSEASQALHSMLGSGLFAFDETAVHNISHTIGRKTAEVFGVTGDAFLMCPNDFDYGCQHGFVEVGLAEAKSPYEVVFQMCESMPDVPSASKANCYHGAGHALMMNYSYDLYTSLDVCDMFDVRYHHSCQSGVFMENTLGAIDDRILPEYNTFRKDDPLAPCTDVGGQYKEMCYAAHTPYLMFYYNNDLESVMDVCVNRAEEGYQDDCIYDIGTYVVIPHAQPSLSLLSGVGGDFMDKGIYICNQFPEQYRSACYKGNIIAGVVDFGDKFISQFCDKLDERYQRGCWQDISDMMSGRVFDADEMAQVCASAPQQYQRDCLGVHVQDGGERVVVLQQTQSPSLFSSLARFFNGIFTYLIDLFVFDESAVSDVPVPTLAYEVGRCVEGLGDRVVCYAALCEYEPGYLCAERIVDEVTALYGPEIGLQSLSDILPSAAFNLSVDGHQLAHTIGRSAAKHFGMTVDVFNQCSTDFDYGCLHGFFESAAQGYPEDLLVAMFTDICEASGDAVSVRANRFNCYHGIGHGLMMHENYNLHKALVICDTLEGWRSSQCLDGVFMENAIGSIAGRVPEEYISFREDNLLAPCDAVERKYRSNCYSAHYLHYVSKVHDFSLVHLIDVCRGAGEDASSCFRGLARLFIGPTRNALLSSIDFAGESIAEESVFLCNQFPQEYVDMCHRSVVSELVNGDDGRLRTAVQYCGFLSDQAGCFGNIGNSLGNFVATAEQKRFACLAVPVAFRDVCIEGSR